MRQTTRPPRKVEIRCRLCQDLMNLGTAVRSIEDVAKEWDRVEGARLREDD
jgi:hypothetical protein